MRFKKLTKAIHWEQILLYFVAFWLFSHAFQVLACLFDTDTAETVRLAEDPRYCINLHLYDASKIKSLNRVMALGRIVGLIAGFAYTIYLAKKRGGNWVNPTLAFFLALLLGFFNLLGWSFVKNIFLSPGSMFNGVWYYLVDGVILLLLGGGIIYYNHKIRKRKSETDEDVEFA